MSGPSRKPGAKKGEIPLSPQGLADLSESVLGDLDWLFHADLGSLDKDGLRNLANRLRRLLNEGSLSKIMRERKIKDEILVTASLMDAPTAGQTYGAAAGMQRGGSTIAGVKVFNRIRSSEEIKAAYEAQVQAHGQQPATAEMSIWSWLKDGSFYVAGVTISRRHVIGYVSNKLGGVHVDGRRNSATDDESIGALDEARKMQILDLDSVYGEVVAIGQQLQASTDLRAVAERLRRS